MVGLSGPFGTKFGEASRAGYSVRFFENTDGNAVAKIEGEYKVPGPLDIFLDWFDGSLGDIDITAKGTAGNGVHGFSVEFLGTPKNIIDAVNGDLQLSDGAVKLGSITLAASLNAVGVEFTVDILADGDDDFLNNIDFQKVFAGVQIISGTHLEILGAGYGLADTAKAGILVKDDGIYIVGSLQGELGLLIYGDASLTGTYEERIVAFENNNCFLEDSSVQMWPLDPAIKPRLDGSYDEPLVLSKVWYKRQDQMQAGDLVVSPDKWGRLQPGRVTRTMTNIATHILDFWGTGVTPGHAYNCADGPLKGGFAPLMDVLRMDGALMRSDGTMFRSTTNCDVGSMGDMMIHASATLQKPDGTWTEPKVGKVRFGARIILPDGRHMSLMEMAASEGWRASDDGYMVAMRKGEGGELQAQKFPFPYTHGAEVPKPEDYILTRSQVTLEDIYLANEWEQISTRMPAPDSLAGFNPNGTMKRTKPKPNIPPAFANRPDAPTAQKRVQRPAHASASPSAPSMNRKQRRAMEAKRR